MQGIRTHYLGPTNYRGSRIVATCAGGRIVLPWDYALNPHGNHRLAAKAMADKMQWPGVWTAGDLADGSSVWVNMAWSGSDDFTCTERRTS